MTSFPNLDEFHDTINLGVAYMTAVIAGDPVIAKKALFAVAANGHIILEAAPGAGKTFFAARLAELFGVSANRIQGTPDLLPGDVTGSMLPDMETRNLSFHPGPVFCDILLFDELNRTTPKTQSALLECVEEKQVSVDGKAFELPDTFTVIATQNPKSIAGTYSLSEGVSDRFMISITPDYLSVADEAAVLTGEKGRQNTALKMSNLSPNSIRELRAAIAAVKVSTASATYASRLLHHTRQNPEVRLGASTRAGVGMIQLAKANAAYSKRNFVTPDDIQAVAVNALQHRIFFADDRVAVTAGAQVVEEALATCPVPLS